MLGRRRNKTARNGLLIENLIAKRSGELSIGRLVVGPAALAVTGVLVVAGITLWRLL